MNAPRISRCAVYTHLIVVPSAKPTSKDRLSPYRTKDFVEVAARISASQQASPIFP